MSGQVVVAEAVSVRLRRVTVLRDVGFRIGSGITAVIGPNGAGKTTLLRVLATLEPFTGSVEVSGADLNTAHGVMKVRQASGYLPQAVPVGPGLTVSETVAYAGWLKGISGRAVGEAVERALRAVNLHDVRESRATKLSGGQRRRMGIAAAIVSDPALLLRDEPTAGLDPVERSSLLDLMRQLAQSSAVVYSTHLADEVAEAADSVLVVNAGRVSWSGALEKLVSGGRQSAAPTTAAVAAAYKRVIEGESLP